MSPGSLLRLKILTPEGSILEAEALNSVNIPLADGCPIGIRPGHTPLIAETVQGTVYYQSSNQQDKIELHAGILDLRDNLVIILTSGEVSTIRPDVAQSSQTEYDRLMNTLVEKFKLIQYSE